MGTIANMNVRLALDSSDFESGIAKAQGSATSFSQKLGKLGTGMSAAVTAPLGLISGMAFKSAGDFEQSMNVMAQVTGATAGEMATLQQQALDLGATTAFSAGEAAQAMLELGKAGLGPAEIGDAIAGTMDLAAAGNLDLAQAAAIAANAMNAFQLPASDVTNVANMLAAAANASSADVTDLAAGMQMAGAVFASNGQSINDLAAGMAILANNGIAGSDAGTSLKTMLMRLAAPTDEAAGVMADLGIQVFNADGSMRGFADMVGSLEKATKGLTDQERSMALTTIFGADAIRAATILAESGADGFADMQKAVTKEGSAAATAGARMKGLNGAIEYLKGSIDSFLINAAMPFLDSKADMIRKVADLVSAIGGLPAPMRNAAVSILGVVAAIGPALLIGSKLIPVFSMLGAVFGALVSPVGLLVVAVTALVAVFATDFMGVRTALVEMVGNLFDLAGIDLGGIANGLQSLGSYLSEVVADGDPLNDWLTHLPEPIQPAVMALGQLVAAVGGLVQGGDLGAFIASITAIDWGGALTAVGESLGKLAAGMADALNKIDWGAALETAGGWLDSLKSGVVAAIQGIPWGAALTAAGNVFALLSGWVGSALQGIDWDGMLTTAAGWLDALTNGVVAAIQSIDWGGALTAAGDWLANLWGGVTAALQEIDWTAMFTQAGDWLGRFTKGVVNRLKTINWGAKLTEAGDFLAYLWRNVAAALGKIDWGTALSTATTWLTNLSTQVVSAIQGIDWAGALTAAGDVFAGLGTALADALGNLGLGDLTPALDGIKAAFAGVPAAISSTRTALGGFWAQTTAIGAQLSVFFAPALGRLQEAFTALPEKLTPLMPKLQAMGEAIDGLMQALAPFIALIGFALAIAVDFGINSLTAAFETLPDTLGPIIEQITATINLISTTLTGVVGVVQGIIDGDWAAAWESAKTIANGFSTFFRGLFARLGTFMGAVAKRISDPIINTLKDLGVDIAPILEGIRKTFDDIWTKVAGYIQPVIDLVASMQTAFENFKTWLGTLELPNPFAGLQSAADAVMNAIGAAGNAVSGGGEDGDPSTPRALGGPVMAGGRYLVGERGPELFVPNRAGSIIPNNELGGMWGDLLGAGAGGAAVTIENVTVQSEIDVHALAYQVAQLLNRRR